MAPKKILFSAPIAEFIREDDNTFKIKGVAINATTTKNQDTFLASELRKSASTLKNKPLLKNHENSIDAVIGKVTESKFSETHKRINFEAKVTDEAVQQKMEQGVLGSVSVGAFVESVEEISPEDSDSGKWEFILHGIEFAELSVVAVPADAGAGFALAIAEGFELDDHKKRYEKLKQGDAKLVEDKSTVEELRIKNEKLEEEIETLKNEKLVEQRDKLLQEDADPEEEPAADADPDPAAEPKKDPEEDPKPDEKVHH